MTTYANYQAYEAGYAAGSKATREEVRQELCLLGAQYGREGQTDRRWDFFHAAALIVQKGTEPYDSEIARLQAAWEAAVKEKEGSMSWES